MKLKELIKELKSYNQNAYVDVVTDNKSYKFTVAFGSSEGCTKQTADVVSFYVDKTCELERLDK